jgi:hypothetical protein
MPADDEALARTAIAVLARVPVPGRVKTRLIPRLGPRGASDLHAALTAQTLVLVEHAAPALATLWLAGDPAAAAPCDRAGPVRWFTREQPAGDLGRRMLAAIDAVLQPPCRPRADEPDSAPGCDAVLLIGTDCPARTAADLRAGAAALRTHDVVMQPALDGGYVMIGVHRRAAQAPGYAGLFDGLSWGSATVAQDTRARAVLLGWRLAELRVLPDLDTPSDYDMALQAGLLPSQGGEGGGGGTGLCHDDEGGR